MIDAILYFILHADEIVSVDAASHQMMPSTTAAATSAASGMPTSGGGCQNAGVIKRRQRASDAFIAVAVSSCSAYAAGAATNATFRKHFSLHHRSNLAE